MKFNELRHALLLKIFLVVIFIIILILHPRLAYFSSRCLDYKQKEFSRKLNDRIVDYSAEAKLNGIKPCKDAADLKRRISKGELVKVASGNKYKVEKMTFSYPCVTKDSKALLDEIARRFSKKSSQKGLKRCQILHNLNDEEN